MKVSEKQIKEFKDIVKSVSDKKKASLKEARRVKRILISLCEEQEVQLVHVEKEAEVVYLLYYHFVFTVYIRIDKSKTEAFKQGISDYIIKVVQESEVTAKCYVVTDL